MKKATLLLLIFCLTLAGCGEPGETPTTMLPETTFTVGGYGLQITADSSFRENTGGSFDLQITNDKSYVSIMAYRYGDLPEGTTAQDVFAVQNEELLSKRDAVYTDGKNYDWLFSFTNQRGKDLSEKISVD